MGERDKFKRYSIIAGVGEIDGIRAYKGSKILSIAESISGKRLDRGLFAVPLAVDTFYSFFLPVPAIDYSLVEGSGDEALLFRVSTLSALLSSRRFHRLKALTTADSTTSVVASASFIERLARLMEHARAGGGHGRPREDGGEGSTSSLVERALEQAEHDARVAKSIKSLIARTGAGNTSMLSYGDNPEEILRLARNTNVERILRIVMGVKFSLASKSKLMKRHSRGWLGGIEYGSDLERLHYSQLALPEELFLAKLADSKLLLYEKALPATKGPIYVLLDKSGSMIGEKIDWARAVAVALLQRSAMENRPFYARFFDSTVYPLMKVSKSTHPSEVLDVLKYLATVRAGGGTNITGALLAAIDDVVSVSKDDAISDIVIITDGEDRIDVEQVMRSMSKTRLNIISVMIQGHNNYLKRLSTRYMTVRKLGSESILEVVDFE